MKRKPAIPSPVRPNPEKEAVDYEIFTSEAEVMEWCEANAIELLRELDEAEAEAERRRMEPE